MPALNFKQQFAGLVSGGRKTQTIRAVRKKPIKVGDTLYLYTGMRHPGCRRLGVGRCTGVEDILIGGGPYYGEILMHGRWLTSEERGALARKDGFACATEMIAWFKATHGLPFHGHVIRWVLT
ncbi:MAG: hypothetical protein PHU85_01975 [Phycisphaerae bacterium]|nr:hypothetical protein [Phycisphaerae bacterium]